MTSKIEFEALALLRAVELTQDMDTEHLKKLASIARAVQFSEGEVIYSRGDAGKALYLIREGEVVIETDVPGQTPVVLQRLGPGLFFGWSSLFPSERKMFSTRAVKPTRALAFNASQLKSAWKADHGLEYAMIRRTGQAMANRIKASRYQLAEMVGPPTRSH